MNEKKFEITIFFKDDNNPNFENALSLARKNPTYIEKKFGKGTAKHTVSFDLSNIRNFFELYDLSSEFIIDILINGKTRPFTRELWLPLLWFYK